MAGIPCINTTCSITSDADSIGRLNLNVVNAPAGGISCIDGQGESILLDPSPANALTLSAAGLLGTKTTAQLVVDGAGGTRVDFPASTVTADSANFSITNTSTTITRMMIVETKYRYQFTRQVNDIYWTDGTFITTVTHAGGTDTIDQTFSIAGPDLTCGPNCGSTTTSASGSDVKAIEEFWTKHYFLNPGQVANIASHGAGREGHNTVSTGGNNGFTAFHKIWLVDVVQVGSGLGTYTP